MEALYYAIADHLNYWWVMLFMTIESSFIPFPSEIVIIPAAYIAANQGTMTLTMIIVVGTIGAIAGALINYGLSVWLGRPLIHRFADTKVAHMLLIDLPGVERAEQYFADHGVVGTLVGRLIPAIRQLISIPAGLAKMKLSTFVLCTTAGAGIWNAFLALLGYYVGQKMPEDALIDVVQRYSGYVKWGIAAVVALGLAYYIYKVIKANRATTQRNS